MQKAYKIKHFVDLNKIKPFDTITLTYDDRYKRRILMKSDNGFEFLLDLQKTTELRTGNFIELDDGSLIHIRDEGNKDGKTLVMVHGFNGSLFNFETMTPFLKDQFRILSLDLPAHGLTGSVKSNLYSYDGFYRVISEVLEKQDIRKFYLIGHSMGGMVASVSYTHLTLPTNREV